MNLPQLISTERVVRSEAKTKAEALEHLAKVIATAPGITVAADVLPALIERERASSTGVGNGVAVPHVKLRSIREPSLSVLIFKEPIPFESIDGSPVPLLVGAAYPDPPGPTYLQTLSAISKRLASGRMKDALASGGDPTVIHAILTAE
jgi:PTS system nitrogen regulatory IIA component